MDLRNHEPTEEEEKLPMAAEEKEDSRENVKIKKCNNVKMKDDVKYNL